MALPPVAGNPQRTPMVTGPVPSDDDILDQLRTARGGYAQQLAELSTMRKPTYELNGQMVKWQEYQAFLIAQIAACNVAINAMDPFEEIMQGYT